MTVRRQAALGVFRRRLGLGLGLGLLWLGMGSPRAALSQPSKPETIEDKPDDPLSAQDEAATRVLFDRAMERLGTKDAAQATAELQELARKHPHSALAPEALFVAAQQLEEQLGQPDEALRLYRVLVANHPDSRLIRRTESRIAQLSVSLQSGAAQLVRFQTILRTTSDRSPERATQLQALLTDVPQFALADQVMYLLLDGAIRQEAPEPAIVSHMTRLVTNFPHSDFCARGQQVYAEHLVRSGRYGDARRVYLQLGDRQEPLWQKTATDGLSALAEAERRRLIAATGGLTLLGSMLGIALRRRRELWPPPLEVAYYLPVGLFFVLVASLLQGAQFARPLLVLLLGGVALCWLSAAAARSTLRPRSLVLGTLWRGGLAALLCYLAIERQGLLELVLETLRNGPEH